MKILLTGSASHLATATLPFLLDNDNIKQIIGVDLKPPTIQHKKYQHYIGDIRSDSIATHMQDIDALIHMAFIVDSGSLDKNRVNRDYIRQVNVDGTKHVFNLAFKNNVAAIIHLSSAVVYGGDSGDSRFVDETASLQKIPGFYYSEDKVDIEVWLNEIEQNNNITRIIRFRPHIILGQHIQPLVRRILKQPFYVMFPDPQPLTQCVWEGDVALAIEKALFSKATGAFNLASHEVTSFRMIQQHIHNYALPMPYSLFRKCHALLWKSTGRFGDPAWVSCMKLSFTLDNQKAKQELDWQPSLNLFDCLDATI